MNLFPSRFSSPSSFSSSSSSYSSSYSSSSSSSFSFDSTMCTSKKATAGCLTGILRRILCSRGLPTHPSDQIRDDDSVLQTQQVHQFKADHKTLAGSVTPTSTNATTVSAPGIVARLMGLDSMAELPTESSAASLSRSRSMNSVQCFGECDRLEGIHRRVKSTLSFREVPGFTFLENDDNFLVLSFESQQFESKLGSARLKQRPKSKENRREKLSSENIMSGKEKQSRKVGDEKPLRKNDGKLREVTNVTPQSSVKNSSEKKYINSEAEMIEDVLHDRKPDRRRRRRKPSCNCTVEKTEPDCNSEETSPVSVLDFDRQVPGSDPQG
ncbi:vitellogenin isoform X2 [Neltuma alba]|uniref:vitellogenin isoform X2 n=1 Tax=Neltuma alba TaxID=207710 RepID=UPI0010A2D590|nr:vitellogenin isoform X2 [Prosopis alba]